MSRVAVCIAIVLSSSVLLAQEPDTKSVNFANELALFQQERKESEKHFAPELMQISINSAANAEKAFAAGETKKALQFIRDARWQMPFIHAKLPEHVSRVLGTGRRLRHGDRVNSIAHHPDGTQIASASRDGSVRVWNLGNGRELTIYRGHEKEPYSDPNATGKEARNKMRVPSVAYSLDGKQIASCGATEIHVWEAATGKVLHTLKGHKLDVMAVAFSPKDGNILASGGDDKQVFVWDLTTEKPIFTPPLQTNNINAITFTQDGEYLASANHSGQMSMYKLKPESKLVMSLDVFSNTGGASGVSLVANGSGIFVSGASDGRIALIAGPGGYLKATESSTIHRFEGTSSKTHTLAATPDGKVLVGCGSDNNTHTVTMWDIATYKPIRVLQGHNNVVGAVAIRGDSKQAATGDDDGIIKLWDLTTTDEHRLLDDSKESLWTTAYAPDASTYATGGADRLVRVYDAATGKLKQTLSGHKSAVTAVTYLNANTLLSGAGDKLIKIWDLSAEKAIDCTGHTSAVLALASHGEKLIVSGGADKTVRGWNAEGKLLWTWNGKSAVCAVAIQQGAQRIAVGSADGMLTILDARGMGEPKPIGSALAHTAGVLSVAFAPSGNSLATGGGDGIARVWNVPDSGTPVEVKKYETPIKTGVGTLLPIVVVNYSADGKYLVSGGAETVVRIWDVASGAEVRGLRGATDWVTAAAFAPDGRSVIAVGVDQKGRVYELPLNETVSVPGHSKPAKCVAVSRDGKLIATGGEDMTIRLWNPTTGRELSTIVVPSDVKGNRIDAICFIDSETIVFAESEKKLRWYNIKTGKELRKQNSEPGFALAVPEDGSKVSSVWARDKGKEAGFETYPTSLMEKSTNLKIDKAINSAVLSPDGKWGIAGGADGVLRIWDLDKRETVKGDWPIHKVGIADVGVTPDRKMLVAIDLDGNVKVANAETREILASLTAVVEGGVNGLVVSPKSDSFCTLSALGVLKSYDMKGKELRSWKLPYAPNAAVYTADGKKIITANADGTGFILDLP